MSDQSEKSLTSLLDGHTTEKYFIEYNRGLFNHLSHALFALQELGAPVDKAERFVEWMAREKLEDKTSASEEFYDLVAKYRRLLRDSYGESLDELIAAAFPALSSGILGSVLHGLIHLGYGYASRRPWFVCEGLAYLEFRPKKFIYKEPLPDLSTLGKGSRTIFEVFAAVHEDSDLVDEQVIQKLGSESRFTPRAKAVSDSADRILRYVHEIQFPKEIYGSTPALMKWLIDSCVIVYAAVESKNDFFLLHGVTSSWALDQAVKPLNTPEQVLEAVRTFLCCLLTVYVVQGRPALDLALLKNNPGMSYCWNDLVNAAIDHEDHEREHQFKLVQVCKDMSRRNDDPTMESWYRLACHVCLNNEYSFRAPDC